MSVLKGVSLKATSRIHKFDSPVSLENALEWLDEQYKGMQNLDFTFIFQNDSSILFEKGSFTEFDNMDDEDS